MSESPHVGLWQSRMEEGGGAGPSWGQSEWPLPGGTAIGIARGSQGTQVTGREAQMRAFRPLQGSRLTLGLTSWADPFFLSFLFFFFFFYQKQKDEIISVNWAHSV